MAVIESKTIVYLVPIDFPNLGSRGHRILQMGREWKKYGYDVEILIPYPETSGGFSNSSSKGVEIEGITMKCFQNIAENPPSKWKVKLRGFTFSRYVEEAIGGNAKCFILSQIFDAPLSLSIIRYGRRKNIPTICEYMDIPAKPTSVLSKVYWFINDILMKKVYREADMLWLISEHLVDKVKMTAPQAKTMKVPAFASEPDRVNSREIESFVPDIITKDIKIVTYAGTFDEHQGVSLLIEAFSHVHRFMPNTMLLLAGDNKNQELPMLAEKLGLGESVRFLGYVPRNTLFEIFRYSDVLVCAKLPGGFSEAGFSTKFVDYLLSGTITIASRLGEQALVARDNEEVIFFEPGNKGELVRKLNDTLKHPDEAKRIGEAGKTLIIKNFGPSVVMEKTISKINNLLL